MPATPKQAENPAGNGMAKATTEPTTLIIFGATGDLAQHKLFPALFHLFSNGYLPDQFQIVGIAKDESSHEEYRDFVREAVQATSHHHRPAELEEFIQHVHYQTGLFEDKQTYLKAADELARLDEKTFNTCSNKLFYLAVPPTLYDVIFENLATSGLTIPCGGDEGWTRVLVEKPFGRDLQTAQELDRKLGQLFQEEQIFRIDHYLAKETVQNVITFRFANAIFEPLWNNQHIERVDIRFSETIGVGQRGSFYEDVGALRDVGQNHLLQLLALVAMEDPQELKAEAIRPLRAALLKQLIPIPASQLADHVTRGQYQGYRDEHAVGDESQTETYFRLVAQLDNDRWRGVPFILESGKKLAENNVEIVITFKESASCVCPADDHSHHRNILTIRVQPDEGISIRFWAKKPGLTYELEPKTLSFFYKDSAAELQLPDAYEKVLYDCIRGDQTLFASTDEVTAAWAFITPILENWHTLPLLEYEPGSPGPQTESH